MPAKLPSVEEQEAYFDEQDRKQEAAAAKKQQKWAQQLAIEQEKTRRELVKIESQARIKQDQEDRKQEAAAAKEQQKWAQQLAIEQEKNRQELVKIESQARIKQDQEERKLESTLEKEEKKRLADWQRQQAARAKEASTAKPLSIPYSPPAGRVRMATGQVLPTTTAGWVNSLLGVAAGTAVGVIIPGLMPANEKWAGAAVTGLLSLALLLTSPVASIPQEAGLGMFGASVAYFYFNLTGQICNSNQSASPVVMAEIAPDAFIPLPVAPQPMISPWEEYAV